MVADSQLKQNEESDYEAKNEPIVCAEGVEGCVEVYISTGKTISKLMAGIFIVSIMGYVESIAIAKGFARKFNYKIDPGQEKGLKAYLWRWEIFESLPNGTFIFRMLSL